MAITYHLSPADLIAQSDLTDLAQDATEWRLLAKALRLDAAATHTTLLAEINRLHSVACKYRTALRRAKALLEDGAPTLALNLIERALASEGI